MIGPNRLDKSDLAASFTEFDPSISIEDDIYTFDKQKLSFSPYRVKLVDINRRAPLLYWSPIRHKRPYTMMTSSNFPRNWPFVRGIHRDR